ncbi:hypothetical protein Drorol1_Dr00014706 [Drosera rotundifolia]
MTLLVFFSTVSFIDSPIPRLTSNAENRRRFGPRLVAAGSGQLSPTVLKMERPPPFGEFVMSGTDEEFAGPASRDLDRERTNLLVANEKRREEQVRPKCVTSFSAEETEELEGENLEDSDLEKPWIPLLDYLTTFGLNQSHFIRMYKKHFDLFRVNVSKARERLEYLLEIGIKEKDIKKILVRHPIILDYTVEEHLKLHVAFLVDLGIPESKVGKVIAGSPSIVSFSIENSLKPKVRYLIDEVGVTKEDLSKVIQLSPQILTQRIDTTWNDRYAFLSEELGAPRDAVVKMIVKHPQLLHYRIQEVMSPIIDFLRSIGMEDADILKILTSHTQVFSLSLERNLRPKYLYLINELQHDVKSLTKYPSYLSLSLNQRIRPRHRFLEYLNKAPGGPFPLGLLLPSDEFFCKKWAGTSTNQYFAFRETLLLQDHAALNRNC